MKLLQKAFIFLVLLSIFTSCNKDNVLIPGPILPPPPPASLTYTTRYAGLSWDSTAAGFMIINMDPSSKLSVPAPPLLEIWAELVQQGTNTIIALPYVNYDDVSTTSSSIFFSIKPDPPDGSGEMMPGPVFIFARQNSAIDFTKKVDATLYVKR